MADEPYFCFGAYAGGISTQLAQKRMRADRSTDKGRR